MLIPSEEEILRILEVKKLTIALKMVHRFYFLDIRSERKNRYSTGIQGLFWVFPEFLIILEFFLFLSIYMCTHTYVIYIHIYISFMIMF